MVKRLMVRCLRLSFCIWLVLLLGCAGPLEEARPTSPSSFLPTSAQAQAQAEALAIPADLQAKINEIVAAESCKVAENDKPDPRYVAQSSRDYIDIERKLVFAILQYALEKKYGAPPVTEPKPVVEDKPITKEHPVVQLGAGAVGGAALGVVPLAPQAVDVAIELKILPKGTYMARVGRVCGEAASGIGQIVLGCTGTAAGIGMSGTGGGAVAGVPLAIGSVALIFNGCATLANAASNGMQLAHEGPPSEPSLKPSESSLAPSEVELPLLKPKPSAQAPVAAAPPPKAAAKPPVAEAPPPGTMIVHTKDSGTISKTWRKPPPGEKAPKITETITTNESGNVTTTREKGAPAQVAAPVKPKASDAPTTAVKEKTEPRLPPRGTPERRAIETARQKGVDLKMAEELATIRSGGQGSAIWTEADRAYIREKGKFPPGTEWHHDPTVANRPDLAADPAVIKPVRSRKEHLEAHGGDWRKP